MTPEYKDSLVKSIENVLSKAVDDHRKKLYAFLLEQINFDLSCFEKLDGYQECVKLVTEFNMLIPKSNGDINQKMANPYEPINRKCSDYKAIGGKTQDRP